MFHTKFTTQKIPFVAITETNKNKELKTEDQQTQRSNNQKLTDL